MNKHLLFVANWKMNMVFNDAVSFVRSHKQGLETRTSQASCSVVICPSLHSIYAVKQELKNTSVHVGAQNCSEHPSGNFTGDVSATSVSQAGASYIIIGHSERRQHHHETDQAIAAKCQQVLQNNLTPIVCIGETLQERAAGRTLDILEQQLAPVLEVIKQNAPESENRLVFAYEPVWSIGTGQIPTTADINTVFTFLVEHIGTVQPRERFALLYGGSVGPDTVADLCGPPELDGFLVGGASLDFQTFEKIIDYALSNQL